MNRLVRGLVGVTAATALLGAVGATGPVAQPAAAATSVAVVTYVSTKYTAPKKGQTNAGVKALQLRLVKAKKLQRKYVTSYFGTLTEQAVKSFQRANELTANGKVSRATWAVLVQKTGKIKVVQPRVTGISPKCMVTGKVLCVNKTKRKLYYMRNKRVIRTLDARFGCAGTATREGTFRVNWKSRHHVSSIYHTPMPYAMFFSGG
jgi:murein L,D-transpeptidase YcbB/YkuD